MEYVEPIRAHVRVTRNELTCLGCGEIAMGTFCPRCGNDEEDGADTAQAALPSARSARRRAQKTTPALIPTLNYLRDGEYELV